MIFWIWIKNMVCLNVCANHLQELYWIQKESTVDRQPDWFMLGILNFRIEMRTIKYFKILKIYWTTLVWLLSENCYTSNIIACPCSFNLETFLLFTIICISYAAYVMRHNRLISFLMDKLWTRKMIKCKWKPWIEPENFKIEILSIFREIQ